MKGRKRTRTFWFAVPALLALAGLYAIKPAGTKLTADVQKAELFPYHTTALTDKNDTLVAYELHYDASYYGMYAQYSAVIRNINPVTDNYKAYCKAVIRDIKRINGGDIAVTIYDSYEAWWLSTNRQRFMTKQESDFVAAHAVATFNGDRDPDGDCYCSLSFYEDAANGLYEKQSFIVN